LATGCGATARNGGFSLDFYLSIYTSTFLSAWRRKTLCCAGVGGVCLLVQEPDTYSSAFASIAFLISIGMMAFCAYAPLLASAMLLRFAVN